jgi:ATP-dependent Zn protease
MPDRTPQFIRRLASHEAGHAYVGRCMGTVLHSVSIIPGNGFEGRCRSIGYQSQLYEKPEHETIVITDLCERAQHLMPELGVNRIESAEFF